MVKRSILKILLIISAFVILFSVPLKQGFSADEKFKVGIMLPELEVLNNELRESSVSVDLPSSESVYVRASTLNTIDKSVLNEYKNVVVGCDIAIVINNIACDYSNLNADPSQLRVFYKSPLKDLSVGVTKDNSTTFYLVPLEYIVTPKYNRYLEKVFEEALSKSDVLKSIKKTRDSEKQVMVSKAQTNPLSNEVTRYLLWFCLVTVFVASTSSFVNNYKINFCEQGTYTLACNKAYSYYLRNRKYLVFSILVASTLLAVFLLTLLVLFGFSYQYEQLILNSIAQQMPSKSNESLLSELVRFVSVFILVLDGLLALAFVLPAVMYTFINTAGRAFRTKFTPYFYRIVFVILVLAVILLCVLQNLLPVNTMLVMFVLTCIVTLILVIKSFRDSILMGKLYNRTEKLVLTTLILVGLLLSLYNLKYATSQTQKVEDLFRTDRNLITLPYYKDFEKNAAFRNFPLTPAFPIYINGVKVFDPKYKELKNLPLSEFNSNYDWEVVLLNEKNFPKSIINQEILLEKLRTGTTNNYLYIEKSNPSDEFKLRFDFMCKEKTAPREITGYSYYQTLSTEKADILYYPGCSSEDVKTGSVTHTVPLFVNSENFRILKLTDIGDLNVKKIVVTKNGSVLENSFIKAPKKEPVVIDETTDKKSDTLHIFSDSISEPLLLQTDAKSIDLGELTNDLKEKNVVRSPFVIWSTDINAILRNSLQKDFFTN